MYLYPSENFPFFINQILTFFKATFYRSYFHVSNNILYSSQREIKAVIRSHNAEHISITLSHEIHTYTLLNIRPLSLNLHTLIANPKLPGIMLSLSNQNVKTLQKKKKYQCLLRPSFYRSYFHVDTPLTRDITTLFFNLSLQITLSPPPSKHFFIHISFISFSDRGLRMDCRLGFLWCMCMNTDCDMEV